MAFDQQIFLLQEYGGISRYFCSLAREFLQKEAVDARIVAPLHFNKNLSALENACGSGYLMPNLHPKLRRVATEIGTFSARYVMNRFAPDIIHETYFTVDDFRPRKCRRVLTVYDLIHERYSELFEQGHKTTEPKKAAALRADHVICISNSTRRDLIEYCGLPEERVSVIYLGVDEVFRRERLIEEESFKRLRPFVLFVGSRGGYKNFDGLIHAFSSSPRLVKDFDIVCFGGGGLTSDETQLVVDCGLRKDQVTHYGGPDEVLAQLYFQAAAFIYPSFYEGFGIPPLEAMATGCPVISSNTSSLPEVVGEAGEYFDPKSKEEMLTAMENVLYSEERRAGLVRSGYEQEAKFSWAKCADETQAIYRSLV